MNHIDAVSGGLREDYIITAMTADGLFRVLCARSTRLVEEVRRRHSASKTATAALGRVLTGAALMAATLDDDQSVTVRVLGDGPAGGIIAEAVNSVGNIGVRAYMGDPSVELPLTPAGKLDVGGLVGHNGYVHVIKDLGLKEPYSGSAEIQSGEIGIDLAYYYTVSEQLPTAISLGVRIGGLGEGPWISGAGGLMVQVMPGATQSDCESVIDRVQRNIEAIGSVSQRVQEGASPEELVSAAFAGVSDIRIMNRMALGFACKCSRERAEATLMGLGKEDLLKLSGEQEKTEVRCHFCNEVYPFAPKELGEIALNAPSRPIQPKD